MSHQPTDEQLAVADHFATGEGLVVEAGAGTGKTTTLKACAAAAPRRRGIYVAYNRPLKDAAAKSFPRTVRASTTHGLAFGPVATRYERAGRKINGPRQRARDVAEILRINEPIHIDPKLAPLAPTQIARLAVQAIERFCKSGSEDLEPWHIPTLPGMEDRAVRAELRRAVLPYADRAWADITSLNGRLRFLHDHYLKIFQLTHPKLRADFLLVDEAQDLNPCVAAIMAEQTDAQVVYVGDSCQAINGWNGAVNAMRDAPGRRLWLSQSFRFGWAVADEANKWLRLLNAELRLRGFDQIQSQVAALELPDAVLCRTNAEAVRQVATAVQAGRKAALVGGGDDIRSLAEASIELEQTGSTGHPELCAFRSWAEVLDYVTQDAAGSDLKVAVSLIEAYQAEGVLKILDGLVDEATAEVVVSTAHRSKGREFGTVLIADDFKEPRPTLDNPEPQIPREDMMLAYVAVTRAQHVLDRDGLAWVDNWLPAPAPMSRLAAAVRAHPEAILPDPPDELAEPAPAPPVRIETPALVEQTDPSCRCGHLAVLHPFGTKGRGMCQLGACACLSFRPVELAVVAR